MPRISESRRRDQIVNGITVGVVAIGLLVVTGGLVGMLDGTVTGEDGVGYVEITGIIRDAKPAIRELKHFAERDDVPVVLLRIDSPGGTVGASQEIYRQVILTREQGVKVVASMGTVAASGGYYIAAAADSIMANPGTITGSIGVIAEFMQADTLFSKIGIAFNTISRGRYKATGNSARPMREDERLMVWRVIDDAYRQFVEAIHEARGIEYESLDTLAQGQVLTGRMALEAGLVDTLGNHEDAVRFARRMGGLDSDAPLIRAPGPKKSLLERLTAEASLLWNGPSFRVSYLMQ